MVWQIKFTEPADKQLLSLDKPIARRIIKWLEERIPNAESPKLWGSGLTGDKSGKWRYRIGDYRVVCEIQDSVLIVKVKVAHRRHVYD